MPKRLGCMNGWVVTYNGKIAHKINIRKAMYNINMKIKVKIYTRLTMYNRNWYSSII